MRSRPVEEILAALPDIPRWVETRGMLLSGRYDFLGVGERPEDVAVRASAHPLVAIAGDPPPDSIHAAAASDAVRFVLCDPDNSETVCRELPLWKHVPVRLHRLADGQSPRPIQPVDARIGILPASDGARLAHLPPPLRSEVVDALDGGHVAAALIDGLPVAFCYPVWETETLWDVSIDTLEDYRRRGLAAACVEFLIDHMRRHGKEPVWGALEDNAASLALAARLGFRQIDEMAVYVRRA